MENTVIRVRKANSILQVPAMEKDSYLAKGYDILGEDLAVLEESVPTDTATLQAKYSELKAENARLKAELNALNTKATTPKKTTTKRATKKA